MKPELEEKLLKKYPKIFRQRWLDPKDTCMCWGIETEDGWYFLIDNLCRCIQSRIDCNRHAVSYQVEASQVKEKFGTLRFYIDWVFIDDKKTEELRAKLYKRWYKYLPKFKKILHKIKLLSYEENLLENQSSAMNEIEGMISFAEHLSGRICESCGKEGKLTGKGWVTTLCDKCLEERSKKK